MLSPMMTHYLETKKQYPDCILFYRLGDFYEMFFEDAQTVSKELDLILTGKDCGLPERAPMCGVPYHAVEGYLNRLVEKGYKVAIAEQMEDPRLAKGLVKREVIRIVTPGTNISDENLSAEKNNFLMSVYYGDRGFGIALCDVSTGTFMVTEADSPGAMVDEIDKHSPSEIICNEAFLISGVDVDGIRSGRNIMISSLPDSTYTDEVALQALLQHFRAAGPAQLGLADYDMGTVAAGALIHYLDLTQKTALPHISEVVPYKAGKFMALDSFTRRNLELTETLREKNKRGTLLWVLDQTRTAMGGRTLRQFIEQPLIDKKEILRRQNAVKTLVEDMDLREEMREYLNPIRDLERLMARVSYGSINPKEVLSFARSLEMVPHVRMLIRSSADPLLRQIYEDMDDLKDVTDEINSAICDDPPLTVHEGDIIRDGYSEEVDRLRRAKTQGKEWIAALEAEEKERTGIKNLRIKYNRVFGYYLEVTNSYKDLVPEDYIRKQTLTNAERYTTMKLKSMEEEILGAEDRLYTLEYDLFREIRDMLEAQVLRIQKTSRAIGTLDVLASLADVAVHSRYVKPSINEKGVINIKGGRHPVVEKMMDNGLFIENDTYLDNSKNRVSIITGPNMAGKSTYMRQTALIVLLAQIGSFVPADSADIGICDRIFTRVGASDDLASGQSTFMVEMNEVANILANATRDSLLILDEIGRGTSTYDGMSIAWSVVEYISNPRLLGAKTLFATHYHELSELEGFLPGVQNYCIAVKEQGDNIVFLRKIVKGSADKSYGIQVAKLAGLPDQIIERAKVLVEELTDADITARAREIAEQAGGGTAHTRKQAGKPDDVDMGQLSLFDTVKEDDILEDIKSADLSQVTPIEALNMIYTWQSKLNNRWK